MILGLSSGTWITTRNYATSPRTGMTTGPNGVVANAAADMQGPSPAWFSPALWLTAVSPAGYATSAPRQEIVNGSSVIHISIWPVSASNPLVVSFLNAGEQVLTGPYPQQQVRQGQCELYIDPSTMLPETLTFSISGFAEKDGAPDTSTPVAATAVAHFSDYQQVQGHPVPFHVQVSFAGAAKMDIQLSSAVFNTGAVATPN